MIRQEVGNDSLFFEIMTGFLEKYKHGNASGADFRDHVAELSGRSFDQFFDQWYYGQGYPIHSIRWEHHNDTLYINSLQTVSSETPFFNLLGIPRNRRKSRYHGSFRQQFQPVAVIS
jgi:aminopeptidase N